MLSIKQVVGLSGLSENYIRKAIARGDLKVTKSPIGETRIEKNWIDEGDFEAWRSSTKARSKREDGRNKFVLYMNEDEEAELRKMIEELEFGKTLARANMKATE